ncbi:hypothetical protein VCHA50O407_100053 [Vibrio chagasii]|nr:hypothetical protein VCHA50O407_100053 [Vibrio chagasii]CAH7446216.1 hypothetical protein VCHA50P424_90142 [Vibrio chagasii]
MIIINNSTQKSKFHYVADITPKKEHLVKARYEHTEHHQLLGKGYACP